jgi:hypothetical protein
MGIHFRISILFDLSFFQLLLPLSHYFNYYNFKGILICQENSSIAFSDTVLVAIIIYLFFQLNYNHFDRFPRIIPLEATFNLYVNSGKTENVLRVNLRILAYGICLYILKSLYISQYSFIGFLHSNFLLLDFLILIYFHHYIY